MIGVIVFFWIIFGIMAGSIAYSKNRFWPGWAIMGLLLGIFAVIWVACLGSLDR